MMYSFRSSDLSSWIPQIYREVAWRIALLERLLSEKGRVLRHEAEHPVLVANKEIEHLAT